MTNTARSVMLAALLRKVLGDESRVESAGASKKAREGSLANVYTDHLMRHRGFNLSGHQSRWFGDLDLTQFTHIVCVDEKTEEQVVSLLGGYRMIEVLVANERGGGIPLAQGAGWQEHRAALSIMERVAPDIARQVRGE
jgi:protein-tyrosine-phosphatase